MKKNCFWLNYEWFIIQNQRVTFEINSKYATKKWIDATSVDTSNLATKRDFITLKAELKK